MKRILAALISFLSDREDPEEPQYDPAHVGAMVVLTLIAMSMLFWLLWSLLVFGGGIQAKLLPFFTIVFTARTAADYGYVGSPFAMGVFEGWLTNVVALVLLVLVTCAGWYVFRKAQENGRQGN